MNKKFLLKLIAAVFLLLIAFTFISKSIYSAKLPVVTFTAAGEKNLEHNLTVYGELGYLDATQVTAPGAFEVTEVLVERGDAVRAGTPLFAVDASSQELEKASLDLDVLRLENSLASLSKDMDALDEADREPLEMRQREYEAQRDIVLRRLELLTAGYPEGGIIRAEESGIVDRVQIEPGDFVQEGQICVETHSADSPLCVRYTLTEAQAPVFQAPDNTRIVVQSIQKDEELGYDMLVLETLSMRDRQNSYSEETGLMNVTLQLSEPKGTPIMAAGAQVYLLDGIFDPYKGVLPAYCIHRDGEGEFIFVVEQRKTLLGVQNYVTRRSVRVLDRTEQFAALDGPINQVVASSTQPLSDGDIVVVER